MMSDDLMLRLMGPAFTCPQCDSADAANDNHWPDCHYSCDHAEALLANTAWDLLHADNDENRAELYRLAWGYVRGSQP